MEIELNLGEAGKQPANTPTMSPSLFPQEIISYALIASKSQRLRPPMTTIHKPLLGFLTPNFSRKIAAIAVGGIYAFKLVHHFHMGYFVYL